MPLSMRHIVKALAFGFVALFLGAVALLMFCYAVFMVLWMHAPLLMVVLTAGLLSLAFLFGSLFSARAIWRTLRAGA
ncbi:MAG: hypothetical protein JWR68_3247 [Polaromonas sp.]|nr:hypothetical protein [Polaromonas sp.]